ncbi:MAG: penicillin acylase family protein [Actinomycetes bacterium]
MRRPAVLAAVLLAAPLLAVPAAGQSAPPPDAGDAVMNVLPPGSRGNVDAADALAAGTDRQADAETPANVADQLEMYDALTTYDPAAIGEDDLPELYKDAPIDLPADQVVSEEAPRPGVVVRRDRFGVPFVTGETAEDVAFGAGWAGTHDRMFLTDLLRHVGAARTAEFLGASEANLAMDRDQLRAAAYTREEAQAQIESVLGRYPEEGEDLLARLDAFIAGINAAQRALCPVAFGLPVGDVTGGELEPGAGFGPECPVEYAVLANPPTDFDRSDIVYIASLVGGIFGKGGGSEATNARWLRQLQGVYGDAGARQVFEDLRFRNDPEAPTTAQDAWPYEGESVDPTAPGAALPDLDGPTAPSTGSEAEGSELPVPLPDPLAVATPRAGVVDGPFGPVDLGLSSAGSMSNALLVGAERTTTGHPLVVFGPQTGYFTPQLLTEISLRGPGIAARGVSFAGTQLIVELGHGVDYAWSATSASSDNVDTVVERLCSTDGGEVTLESDGYLVGSTCTPIDTYVHEQTVIPTAGGQGAPQLVRMKVERTRHGIVQERTTVDDAPVALVLQRSTYGRELDSAVGFARINDPDWTVDAETFMTAFAGVDYTFNWFYADAEDIAYFGSGLLPLRAPGHNPDLPRWGDPRFDWQGTLPDDEHARDLNPAKGFLSSWNNKQAPQFSAADGTWGYGPVYRSLLLDRRLEAAGTVDRAELVGVLADAAVADLRAEVLLPLLLETIGEDPTLAEPLALLRAWADDPYRVDRDRDGAYSHPAAIALFDEWWESRAVTDSEGDVTVPAGEFSVAKDVLRAELGDLVDVLPKSLDDHPRLGLGSAWNNVAWYGYVSKELRRVLGEVQAAQVAQPFSRAYCGTPEECRETLRASLAAAAQRVLDAQGIDDVSALTYDKSEDNIAPVTAGLVGTREIDWQNRPTFQQVVAFEASRAGADPPPPVEATRQLAATGAPAAAVLGGLVLVAAAALLHRRTSPLTLTSSR